MVTKCLISLLIREKQAISSSPSIYIKEAKFTQGKANIMCNVIKFPNKK